MELKTCPNGHTYDPSISASCPICGSDNAPSYPATVPAGDSNGHTIPLVPDGGTSPTMPIMNSNWTPVGAVPPTEPVVTGGGWELPSDFSNQNGHKMTEPVKTAGGSLKAQPLTGWLVCIDGPEKGKDYRIHEQYNYIGRSPMMDISIANDGAISWERHAVIAYDDRSRKFFFAPFGGGSIVRQNDMPVMSNVELSAGDKIEIGRSTFMFVPFCGENFQWGD